MPVQLNFQEPFIGQTFCVRMMFSGFMVDASNIFRFEGAGESNSSSEYSLEWGIFKPAADKQQVRFLTLSISESRLLVAPAVGKWASLV